MSIIPLNLLSRFSKEIPGSPYSYVNVSALDVACATEDMVNISKCFIDSVLLFAKGRSSTLRATAFRYDPSPEYDVDDYGILVHNKTFFTCNSIASEYSDSHAAISWFSGLLHRSTTDHYRKFIEFTLITLKVKELNDKDEVVTTERAWKLIDGKMHACDFYLVGTAQIKAGWDIESFVSAEK